MKKIMLLVCCALLPATVIFAQNEQRAKASLNHIALYVTDLQRSGDFYSNVIGLDTIPEPFHDGMHIWYRIGPSSHLHVISGADKPKTYFKGNHLCFTVSSVDQFVQSLQKRGLAYEDWNGKPQSITTRVDGVKQIWLQDPDGYWIEVNDARE